MPTLTFLNSGTALRKAYTESGVHSYPLSRLFTSNTHTVHDAWELKDVLIEEGLRGSALHTGQLTTPLINQPRKNAHDKWANTTLCILDIDKIQLPVLTTDKLTSAHVRKYAQLIVQELPICFQETSCVFQASNSFGINKDTISLHLFWLLNESIAPKMLKTMCEYLNQSIEFYREQISTNATAMALKYPIDIVVNDSGRLCYIAPPYFEDEDANPFVSNDERYGVLAGTKDTLSLTPLINNISLPTVKASLEKHLMVLRKEAGLRKKIFKTKTHTNSNDETVAYISNPDAVAIVLASERDEFIGYNVHGSGRSGDSGAYYTFRNNPTVMYNFKGEPPFDFQAADKEAYDLHLTTFCGLENAVNEKGHVPLVFQDYKSSDYFYVTIEKDTDAIIGEPTNCKHALGPLKNFVSQFNAELPDTLPLWNVAFDPTSDVSTDWDAQTLNTYIQPQVIKDLPVLPQHLRDQTFGYGAKINELCPAICKIIGSACGQELANDANQVGYEDFEHFINWLATIVQRRTKTQVCFVFQGTQGTGKGMMFHHILKPLIGEAAQIARMDTLRDKFNSHLSRTVLMAVDEFKVNGKRDADLTNNLKSLITEGEQAIRGMYKLSENAKNYTNFVIFTNDLDAVYLDHTDRRFRVCPRQEVKLTKSFPQLLGLSTAEMEAVIQKELPYFAAFLMSFSFNEIKHRENEMTDAKHAMIMAGKSAEEEFFYAIKTGDLAHVLPVLYESELTNNVAIPRAKKVVLDALLNLDRHSVQNLALTDVKALYNSLAGFCEHDNTMAKKLRANQINTKQLYIQKQRRTGLEMPWHLNGFSEQEIDELIKANNQASVLPFTAKIS